MALVSLSVHFYLVLLSTWFGAVLHVGYAGDDYDVSLASAGGGFSPIAGSMVRARKELRSNAWLCIWAYLIMASPLLSPHCPLQL